MLCFFFFAVLYFGFSQPEYSLAEGNGLVNSTVYIVKENFADVQTSDNITISLVITGGSSTLGTLYTANSEV